MSRLLSTVLVIGLLGGTAAAFAVTEGLKLQRSPITSTQVPLKVFSPVCGCSRRFAPIAFRLRKADRVTVKIENDQGTIVRTLVAGKASARGRFSVSWDGRDDAGNLLPQGSYKPRVHLARAHQVKGRAGERVEDLERDLGMLPPVGQVLRPQVRPPAGDAELVLRLASLLAAVAH